MASGCLATSTHVPIIALMPRVGRHERTMAFSCKVASLRLDTKPSALPRARKLVVSNGYVRVRRGCSCSPSPHRLLRLADPIGENRSSWLALIAVSPDRRGQLEYKRRRP
jgi:hypothetical protein